MVVPVLRFRPNNAIKSFAALTRTFDSATPLLPQSHGTVKCRLLRRYVSEENPT